MSSPDSLFRYLVIYGLCLPLAIFLGYLLATPQDFQTLAMVGLVLFILMIPLFLRWHHPWLIVSWNMVANIFFLPGQPPLWLGLSAISITIAMLQYILNREQKLLSVPMLNRPIALLALVVIVTAVLSGGFGIRALGSESYGGKRYILIIGSILGYYAITSRRIPQDRAALYVALFFLGSLTMGIGTFAGKIPASLNYIFLIFPVENLNALAGEVTVNSNVVARIGGLALVGSGVFCAMLAIYGIQGVLNIRKPWRLLVLGVFTFIGLLGGFRSTLILFMLICAALFYFEGLMRTRFLPMLIAASILAITLVTTFAHHLPLQVQRALAFLPVDIDPIAKYDAQYSTEWRLQMWREVLPEIPKYFFKGKGYAINPNELLMSGWSARLRPNSSSSSEGAELVGDYHNGPLSVMVPLGIFGVIAFVWFVVAGLRTLRHNFKYGDPELLSINRFLYAFFLAKIVFFMTIFGSLYVDMAMFAGILGLSVSINGGLAQSVPATEPEPVVNRFEFRPRPRRALNF